VSAIVVLDIVVDAVLDIVDSVVDAVVSALVLVDGPVLAPLDSVSSPLPPPESPHAISQNGTSRA